MSDLLQALVDKFCGGSWALALHYAQCPECHVHSVGVDWECEAGERIADEAWKRDKERSA